MIMGFARNAIATLARETHTNGQSREAGQSAVVETSSLTKTKAVSGEAESGHHQYCGTWQRLVRHLSGIGLGDGEAAWPQLGSAAYGMPGEALADYPR